MSFSVSAEIFDQIFGPEGANSDGEKKEQTPTDVFLDGLADYLLRKSSPLAKTMGKHLTEGEDCISIGCREDIFYDLAGAFWEQNIPYAPVITQKGQTGFLFRDQDEDRVKELCDRVLDDKSRVCHVVSSEKLMQDALKYPEMDRKCIALCNLSKAHAEIIKEGFARHFDNAEVGLDEMSDGTFMLTVIAKGAIKKNIKEGPDLCTIFLESVLALGGPNGIKNEAYVTLRIKLMDALANGFDDEDKNLNTTPLWVVGRSMQYLKVTANEFDYGRAEVDGNDVRYHSVVKADALQPDYQQMLNSYTLRIPYPVVSYSAVEVAEHFRCREGAEKFDLLDVSPAAEYRLYSAGEKKIVAILDTLITRKIQNDTIMHIDGKHNEQFLHYVNTLKELMTYAVRGKYHPDFDLVDQKKMQQIMTKYKMDGSMYRQSLELLQTIEAAELTAELDRVNILAKVQETQKEKMFEKTQEKEKKTRRFFRSKEEEERE